MPRRILAWSLLGVLLTSCADPTGPPVPPCPPGAAGCACIFSDLGIRCDPDLTCREGLCFGDDFPAPDAYLYTDQALGDGQLVNALLTERIVLAPGTVVADIGAGQGFYTMHAARRVAPGGRVYATDIDPVALEHIRLHIDGAADRDALAATIEPRLVRTEEDPTGLGDLADGALDLITMFRVFTFEPEDLGEDVEYLRSLVRKLRPGGRFAYHIDVVRRADYRDYLVQLMYMSGLTGPVTEIPMPAHIPEVLERHPWDCENAREPMINMYRGLILVFHAPAAVSP